MPDDPNPYCSLSIDGITVHVSRHVPYERGTSPGWFPIGPDRIVMHPDALADYRDTPEANELDRLTDTRKGEE